MTDKLKFETFFYILILGLLYYMQYQNCGGIYVDTDNYMHALRAIDFINQPSMFERVFTKTNYPFGEISHWTRLMDILLTLCALPFLAFTDLKNAVFAGGFVLMPLCAVMSLYFLQKLGKDCLSLGSRLAMYVMLLMSAQFKMVYKINRPDHHGVIMLFAIWLLWLLYKYTKTKQQKTVFAAALLCAAALWLAVEGVFLYACAAMFLYLGYVFYHFDYKDLVRFTTTYGLGCLFFWLINPPFQGYFYADNGRLSILFVALALLAALIICCGHIFNHKLKQFIFFFICALASFSFLWLNGYLSSPLIKEIAIAFTDRISEMKGGANIYYLTYPLLGLLCLLALSLKQRIDTTILLLSCFLLPYMALSIFAMRFTAYAVLYGAAAVSYWLQAQKFGNIKLIFLLLLLGAAEFVSFVAYSLYRYDLTKPVAQAQIIDIGFLKRYNFPQGAVVSDVFLAPNILWYANRPTVASPYHRNVEGIIDNHRILLSSDMNEVAHLIRKHQVGSIILPLNMDEDFYKNPEQNTDKLYGKMLTGSQYPQWLKEDKSTRPWGYVVLKVQKNKLWAK